MQAIRDYFSEAEKRNPTDIELESIAQTWSEHCKHTIFAAEIDDDIPEGMFKRYIREATVRIRREMGEKDFCVSVFEDNSGGIEFDENYIISDKVETHNSPSALDPFGGAITGIVGVNRDAIGFGMAAKPVANRYGFCFADPFDRRPLYKSKDASAQNALAAQDPGRGRPRRERGRQHVGHPHAPGLPLFRRAVQGEAAGVRRHGRAHAEVRERQTVMLETGHAGRRISS